MRGVREILGEVQLAGCSGEGVISSGSSDEREFAVAVMALTSDSMRFQSVFVEGYDLDAIEAAAALAARVRGGGVDDLVGMTVFPDGLQGNCSRFLEELQERLPVPDLALAGGAAGDVMPFERTWQYGGDRVASSGVSALIVRGRGRMETAVSHGCAPIGLERTVTRAEDGWVHEIDGRPAWSIFKEYLDGDPEDLNAEGIVHLCLGLRLDEEAAREYSPYIIRAPLRLDRSTGALYFPGGGIESGQRIQLTRRDPERIREGARACAAGIRARASGHTPAAVFQFDCAGRGRVLFGSRTAREIVTPMQEVLGRETPWIGFHSFGEIAPIAGRFFYHNYTVSLCALFDDEEQAPR